MRILTTWVHLPCPYCAQKQNGWSTVCVAWSPCHTRSTYTAAHHYVSSCDFPASCVLLSCTPYRPSQHFKYLRLLKPWYIWNLGFYITPILKLILSVAWSIERKFSGPPTLTKNYKKETYIAIAALKLRKNSEMRASGFLLSSSTNTTLGYLLYCWQPWAVLMFSQIKDITVCWKYVRPKFWISIDYYP